MYRRFSFETLPKLPSQTLSDLQLHLLLLDIGSGYLKATASVLVSQIGHGGDVLDKKLAPAVQEGVLDMVIMSLLFGYVALKGGLRIVQVRRRFR